MDLDALVLGLLHRHREDLNPTGATFPLPQTPTKSSSLSRSSSYRRGLVAAPGLSRRASGLSLNAPPSRPHSPSPLSGLKLNPHDMVNHSPNRHLSVAASEFRPGATSAAASVASPGGTITSPGPANWSFNGSPLGTPRFQNSTMAAAQTSYFPSVPSPSLATSSTKDIWADQQGAASSNYSPHQEPDAHLDEPPDVFQHVSDWQKQQQQIDMNGHNNNDPGGLNGASGLYTMTPLDVLCSIFADSGVASAEMEAALELHAWDLDKAIEHIIASHHGAGPPHQGHPMIQQPQPLHPSQTGMPDPEELARGINSIVLPGAAPRQPTFGRAGVLARNDGFPSPRGSQPSSPRWGSRPITPTPGVGGPGAGGAPLAPYTPSAASNRVCRYYLQGSCLRSDCRYNHDISKAVCRFWLRGHCLKGPDRCDFMHMIPPHLAQDVAAMKMRMDQERRERREREREMERDDMHSQEEDFPSLGAANTKGGRRDPAANRWASAVKSSKSVPSAALQSLMNEHGPPGVGADVTLPGARVSTGGGERQSPRITLRPPVLLPTLSTGSKMSESYANYRNKFLELGASRARCLSKAAECWKRGDGAGARMWSREAQSQDLERLAAGREASAQIVEERKKLLREAVMQDMSREGRVDLVADRSAKGKEAGGRLGTVLGVISRDSSSQLSPEERTEVAVDLQYVALTACPPLRFC